MNCDIYASIFLDLRSVIYKNDFVHYTTTLVIAPFFLNIGGEVVTVNGDRYHQMIIECL